MPFIRRHLAAAAAMAVAAVATVSTASAQPGEEAAVARAVEDLRAAMVEADRGRLDALTEAQLSYGHSAGAVEDKAQFIDVIVSGRTDYKTITLSDQTVAVAGDAAVVRHVFATDFESGGRPASARVGAMQVWRKRDGQWRLLARQAFRI
jgi:hypothetical protein